jgi:hypothetical protein
LSRSYQRRVIAQSRLLDVGRCRSFGFDIVESQVITSYAGELDAPAAIGRATAVVMSKYGVDVDRARTLLAKIAQRGEVPVETMARYVVSIAPQPRVTVRA